MEETTTREKIFKNVRNALIDKAENPYPKVEFDSSIYQPIKESLDINFAQEFVKVAGKFVYSDDESDMAEKLKYLLSDVDSKAVFCLEPQLITIFKKRDVLVNTNAEAITGAKVGITSCEYLIARLGSIMVSSKQLSGRRLFSYPEKHIVVAYTSQLVPDLKDAFKNIRDKYGKNIPSLITVITGPSRTADIEKTLVLGAHGPRELFVLLVEDN
nr:LUD domain-containing protein [Bacteroidota bacterium]